jgi:hypothetical protein
MWQEAMEKDPRLKELGELQRAAQWRLDFVAAENSMGFHAPQELARILGESIDLSRQAEIRAVAPGRREAARAAPAAAGARDEAAGIEEGDGGEGTTALALAGGLAAPAWRGRTRGPCMFPTHRLDPRRMVEDGFRERVAVPTLRHRPRK